MFSQDPVVLEIGTYILLAMLISALFNGFTGLFTSIFQGIPATIMAVAQGVLFIPVIIMLHSVYGLHGVIWSMTITETITCLMGASLFTLYGKKSNRWKRK